MYKSDFLSVLSYRNSVDDYFSLVDSTVLGEEISALKDDFKYLYIYALYGNNLKKLLPLTNDKNFKNLFDIKADPYDILELTSNEINIDFLSCLVKLSRKFNRNIIKDIIDFEIFTKKEHDKSSRYPSTYFEEEMFEKSAYFQIVFLFSLCENGKTIFENIHENHKEFLSDIHSNSVDRFLYIKNIISKDSNGYIDICKNIKNVTLKIESSSFARHIVPYKSLFLYPLIQCFIDVQFNNKTEDEAIEKFRDFMKNNNVFARPNENAEDLDKVCSTHLYEHVMPTIIDALRYMALSYRVNSNLITVDFEKMLGKVVMCIFDETAINAAKARVLFRRIVKLKPRTECFLYKENNKQDNSDIYDPWLVLKAYFEGNCSDRAKKILLKEVIEESLQ